MSVVSVLWLNILSLSVNELRFYSAPDRGVRNIVMSVSVCVFVRDHISLHESFQARYLWPWLGPPLVA